MFDERKTTAEIKRLIARYHEYKKEVRSEGEIELKLILPLFEALGWTEDDWKAKETVQRKDSRGIPDFTFYLNGQVCFYLEVKKLEVKLSEKEIKQAISYALAKRVPFAILTNFEELLIFCSEEPDAFKKPFRRFGFDQYLNRLAELKLLSKDAFINNELLTTASQEGRLKERRGIDEILLSDLMLMRKKIAADLGERYQDKYSITERDDIIQRLIDRLIFMRKCEDTQINPDSIVLLEQLGHADSRIYSKVKEDFAVYDREFNSGLFKPNYDNDCDKVVLDGAVVKELIGLLYESKDHQYQYNFSWIDADILGQVYEQYLGQILAETKSGRTKLKGGQPHKKEQGIYYTPTSVVEYIVRNTLGDVLKNIEAEEIRRIKVLDPTCGFGSFLIKAFDDIEAAYETKGGQLR